MWLSSQATVCRCLNPLFSAAGLMRVARAEQREHGDLSPWLFQTQEIVFGQCYECFSAECVPHLFRPRCANQIDEMVVWFLAPNYSVIAT